MKKFPGLSMIPNALGAMGLGLTRSLMGVLPSKTSNCPPIVLMHGFAGFRNISVFGIEILQYWNGIPQLLRQMGYEVFVPTVSPLDTPQVRAEQWFAHLEDYRQKHGNEKFIIIAHSQGSIDARLLVCPTTNPIETSIGPLQGLGYGKYVESLVTVGGPHFGNVLVDRMSNNSTDEKIIKDLFNLVSLITYGITGKPENANAAIAAMGQEYMVKEFNPYCIEDPNVNYYAIAGNPQTKKMVSSILANAFEELLSIPVSEGGGPNDGFVTVPSALYGNKPENAQPDYSSPFPANPNWKIVGSTILADHVAEVGLPLDYPPNKFYDHLSCFAGLTQHLDPHYDSIMELLNNGRWDRQ